MNSPPDTAPAPVRRPQKFMQWHRRILGFCLIIFAFELGLFLLIFPWNSAWGMNWIPLHSPRLSPLWMSRYVRGLVSGLGLLNIFVALSETSKQLKQLFGNKPDIS